MVLHSHGDINRLPVQLLALVLQKLDPAAVLQHCSAVAQNWNRAAAMSIRAINVVEGDDEKVAVVAEWLQKHGEDAAVTSFAVSSSWKEHPPPLLLFPAQQLSQLQSLNLKRLRVAPVPDLDDLAAPNTANPVLDPVMLSGLTSMDLSECQMQLQGLPALTNLKHLHINLPKVSPAVDASNAAVVAEAVPQLLQLTSLQLGGPASHDAALAHVTRLTALQTLKLTDTLCTSASFQQLPRTLIMLGVQRKSNLHGSDPDDAIVLEFSSASTPGLAQLTALERLSIRGGGALTDNTFFHVDVLSALTALTRLGVAACSVMAGPGEVNLVVLTSLTRLQHLDLSAFSSNNPPAAAPAEYAAMTSSPQLTHLHLSHVLGPEHAAVLFPDQRQLTTLQSLTLEFKWLEDLDIVERVVRCCPNLQQLRFDSYGGWDIGGNDPDLWAGGIACLADLEKLTKLHLFCLEIALAPPVIEAVAALTNLKDLRIEPIETSGFGVMMQLTACRQLTNLYVEPLSDTEERLLISIQNKAPEGSPPDVWKQIPAQVLTAAADRFEVMVTKPEALHSLLRAAAFASKGAAERQTELEERMQQMEQRVAQLQDNMTAVLAHLQLPGRG